MGDLAEQRLADLLDELGSASPAPGGGSAAALTCGLAAGLVEMVARIELGREPGGPSGSGLSEDVPSRMEAMRRRALALADEELSSYGPVLEARRLPAGDPRRAERVADALERASGGPLAVAEAAAEVAETGERVAALAEPAVRGDAVAGVLLAEAAASAAARLVRVNLSDRAEAETVQRALAAAARARVARNGAAG